jgi:hypothetical protein
MRHIYYIPEASSRATQFAAHQLVLYGPRQYSSIPKNTC